MQHPLIEVAEHVRNQARKSKVAVLFDLDSTLFCVSPRTQTILRRLANEPDFSKRFFEAATILREIEILPSDWGVRQALGRTAINGPAELFESIRDYWHKHFFSSDFLDQDLIYPSANEYVRHLGGLGAEILYLTGRSDARMREGTVKALKRWDFPYAGPEMLLMKPSEVESDEGFKAHAMRELVSKFDHIWFFENEPVIIEQVRRATPQVHIVFVQTVHAGRAAPPLDLRTIAADYVIGLPSQEISKKS